MSGIAERITSILKILPQGVRLGAVSKFHPCEAIEEAYGAGQRVFCESRANELEEKSRRLPSDIEWHFIGHLQTNKVKTVVGHAHTIQSVDSERLLKAIDTESAKQGKHPEVLLQLHVAAEDTKFGLTRDEAIELASKAAETYPNVTIAGVMGMATNTDSAERIERDFDAIRQVFDQLRDGAMKDNENFRVVSMGMSHDYELAIAKGSNLVRIGTAIFGERDYTN